MSERWGTLTNQEKFLIHHALRVLVNLRPGTEDESLAKRLADEIWDAHAASVSAAATKERA